MPLRAFASAIYRHFILTILFGLILAASAPVSLGAGDGVAQAWPRETRESRPWAYWWWMGSAVDKTNLTRELTRYRDAGYGGVHIIPIYGAKGWETNYLSYLSPRWMEMMGHAVSEARRLGMDVDMTTGTGWCFGGGPYVGEREGNALVVVKTLDVPAGEKLKDNFDPKKTQALVAFPADGKCVELTSLIRKDGSVSWTAPPGGAKVYAVSQRLSPQKVKRAAVGGEGPMLNLIYPDALGVFLRSHTEAFDKYRGPKPRAQYHDSYEYKSEWAPDFFDSFAKRRGYRLQTELPAMFDKSDARTARVLTDYRETVSDVMIEDSLAQWVNWSHRRGFLTRNEAHGSPGNLLDLYALADVPETEMFRLDRNKLISKFASSAAHVAGRKLTGCETGTWLKEHFTETLADMKYLLDDLFVSGVNHVFYHGTCYSPDEAGWPGWLFYASFQMNPRNSIWRDVPTLNAYVARCQSILQSGQPDNDILLYWPIHDFWQKAGAEPLLPHLTVHARGWFESQPIGKTAELLWQRGYAFDYISDHQLATAKVTKNGIQVPGGNYRVVVVPPCDFIPLATMEKLLALAKSGATIIFQDHLPGDVPGLGNLAKRQAELKKLVAEISSSATGKGRVLVGDVEPKLATAGIARETLVDHAGLYYIRRSFAGGHHYFIANRGDKAVAGWIPLAVTARSIVVMNPMTGHTGLGALADRKEASNRTEVYLQLEPGASVILRTFADQSVDGPVWPEWQLANPGIEIKGDWRLEFISGGPILPGTVSTDRLASWTELGSEPAQNFAGTARYTLSFDAPMAPAKTWMLSLGNVCQSARVRLNGRELGTLITPPFRVVVSDLKSRDNKLEVEVTNVSANAIRYYDRAGVKWRNFHDINFVNQDYRPFDASNWPLTDSGLMGPVTLTAMQAYNPTEAGQ